MVEIESPVRHVAADDEGRFLRGLVEREQLHHIRKGKSAVGATFMMASRIQVRRNNGLELVDDMLIKYGLRGRHGAGSRRITAYRVG